MTNIAACVDSIGPQGAQTPPGGRFVAVPGETIACTGWAFDPSQPSSAVSLTAVVDGVPVESSCERLPRSDVARHYGVGNLAPAGFRLSFTTAGISLGAHALKLQVTGAAGSAAAYGPFPFEIVSREALRRTSVPRILIAAAPKSGCTNAAVVLKKYFDVENVNAHFYPYAEHMLDDGVMKQLEGKSWVMQMHLWPREPNLANIRKHRVATIVTWRNLADTIVSFDDHLRREWGGVGGGPEVYLGKRELWNEVPQQRRYEFLIRNLVPWYTGFYRAWRDSGQVDLVMRYERMAVDETAYFSTILEHLYGIVDREKLERAIAASNDGAADYSVTRRNVGINGRANEKLSDENKALLEVTLSSHFDDLHELIDELPWRGGAQAAMDLDPTAWSRLENVRCN